MNSKLSHQMMVLKANEMEKDGFLGIQNGHATTNDVSIANAAAHAIAHRSNAETSREAFKTIRHQFTLGKMDEDSGWDHFFKTILIVGGVGLAAYLIYGLVKAIQEQPQQIASGISEVIKSVKTPTV